MKKEYLCNTFNSCLFITNRIEATGPKDPTLVLISRITVFLVKLDFQCNLYLIISRITFKNKTDVIPKNEKNNFSLFYNSRFT